jgi:outer membrane receptor protein involved in Fe transport
MKRWAALFLAILGALTFTISPVRAQTETGAITGTVLDPTGAVVPGAKITVKNVGTNAIRETTTSSSGSYVVPNLQPAEYTITVSAPGFSTALRNVNVAVGSRVGVDIKLEVGETGTTIQVSEAATTVNTETQTIGAVVTTRQMVELPTITRNPYDLVATVGNVSNQTPDGRGVGVAINGQRAASTNILLDGTANNDEFTATVGQTVPLDSVQEINIMTNNFTAEFGRASGGIVNVATKSGTNDFHGTAYEFNRVSALASNEFDNNANGINKPVFTRNQFGYSAGGPIIKNKLFAFSSTEWIRVRSAGVRTVWVPTQQFIAAASPATQAFFQKYGALRPELQKLGTFTKADFAGRGTDLCSGLAATTKCAALPASTPMFDRVSYTFPTDSGAGDPTNTAMTVARIDYNLSEKTQIFGRYAWYSQRDFSGVVSDSPYAGFDSPNTQYNNSLVLSGTHTFAPTFISQSKINFNRFNNQQPFGPQYANNPTLYLGSANVATSVLGNSVALPGYLPYSPGNGIPFGGPQNFLQYYQDISYIKGSHNIRFGGNYSYLRDNRTFGAYQTAIEVLGSNLARGVEGFLNGTLYQFQAAVNPQGKFPCGATTTADCTLTLPVGQPNFSRSNRYNDWALYVQDAWKVNRRLTLNLGLRWEIFGTQHNKDPKLDSNYYLGSGDIYQAIRNGQLLTVPNSPNGELWKTDYNNFAPRIGLAWDVFGDGKTSLRGGYAIGFERNFGNVTFNVIQNPPNYAVLSLFGGVDLPVIPVSVDNAGPLAGSTGSKALGRTSLRAVDPNITAAYAHLFSAAIEHRFAEGVVGAIEYSGSKGENQYGIANINRAGSGLYYLNDPCGSALDANCRLRQYQYSNVNFRMNGGFSNYNGVNFRLDWIGKGGLQMRANYTWSHTIDTLSDTFSSSGNQYNLGWLDPFHPALDKGDAYYDIRHRFVVAAVWDIPYKPAGRLAREVLSGWSFAPIITARTGTPFSLYDCTNGFSVCPYAFLTGPVPISGTGLKATATPNIYNYLDITGKTDSSYADPKTGLSDYGPFPSNMIGRNRFRGPGSWNVDMGVYKSVNITESMKVQFRAEAYNLFNHPNLNANTGDVDVSSISYVSASYSGRRFLQLAAKFIF